MHIVQLLDMRIQNNSLAFPGRRDREWLGTSSFGNVDGTGTSHSWRGRHDNMETGEIKWRESLTHTHLYNSYGAAVSVSFCEVSPELLGLIYGGGCLAMTSCAPCLGTVAGGVS